MAERHRSLQAARELRNQKNIKLRQRLIPRPDDKLPLLQKGKLSRFE